MAGGHAHDGDPDNPRLGLAIALTLGFVAVEGVAGYLAGSLGLMSDAAHNLSDAMALVASWYAVRLARRPASPERTFGWHRAGILVALLNALSLVAMVAVIIWEAIRRLLDPHPVAGGWMIGVALVAVVLNGVISLWLRAGAKHDLNLRSAYLHTLGDAISALGVVVAGILVAVTGSPIPDPAISLMIGAFIIWSSWSIITEALNILMEAAPRGIDVDELERSIRVVPGVVDCHHLHVWSIASNRVALSVHIRVVEQSVSECERILRAVAETLRREHGIAHSTIQVEAEGFPDRGECSMGPVAGSCEPFASPGDHAH